jgi:hypothetical protein
VQRGALQQQPVDAVQARVGEQLLEAEAGAAVGAQVARVEELLTVGLDEQRARVRRRVIHGDAGDRERAEVQRLVVGQQAQVGGLRRAREKDLPDLEDRQRAATPVDGDGGVAVVRQPVVVEI